VFAALADSISVSPGVQISSDELLLCSRDVFGGEISVFVLNFPKSTLCGVGQELLSYSLLSWVSWFELRSN
jgi:hypothetical protein